MKMTQSLSAQERLLETATRLFYKNGLHATGIDRIIAEAEIAKSTFYRYYPSKTDLILAFLEKRHVSWMSWFQDCVAKKQKQGFQALGLALEEWFADEDFNGCAFINAISEGGVDIDPLILTIVCAHKADLKAFIFEFMKSIVPQTTEDEAECAIILTEGMIVRYQMTRDPHVVQQGCAMLQKLQASM
jgi:AcrR family transcriptional regulator